MIRTLPLPFSAALLGAILLAPSPARAVNMDPEAGKRLFREQCLLCHTVEANDGGGAQGPSLMGVVGRHAASSPGFSYTSALRAADLTWDPKTLVSFLTAPTKLVPGTAMVTALPNEADAINVAAYLYFAGEDKANAAEAAAHPATPKGTPDWKKDAPGKIHQIDLAALPAPYDTPSVRNTPKLVPRPAHAKLSVPRGFHVEVFAAGLLEPRKMLLAPNGDVLVSETSSGRVSILHPSKDGRRAAGSKVLVAGLNQPFGLAFYPNSTQPLWLYVAETNRVIRYPWRTGDALPTGAPEAVIPELPAAGGHFTRDIAFAPDGRRLFVSVGSGSNDAENMPQKSPAEIAAWQADHAPGAAWGAETNRADVLVVNVDPSGTPVTSAEPGTAATPAGGARGTPTAPRVFAAGLRNCVSLTVQPATGALWCTTNERDRLGDNLVPDYTTRVVEGGFYGWPWFYMGSNEDPHFKGVRPDLKGKVLRPDVPVQAHSAALNLTFYTASSGRSAFPPEYVGDGFAAFHGSWNRSFRTGHKLVRVLMKDGVPTGRYQDFLTGFIVDDGDAWGRPVATVELADGSLLMSDDGGNLIYRISYRR